jgi:putative FmdB family regulatory protein
MPIYQYYCEACGMKSQVFKKLAELERTELCELCHTAMQRQIVAPAVLGDYPAYRCPVTGKSIEGRRAHAENLARTGCRLLEPGETDSLRRRRKADDDALDKAVEETAERFVHELPTDKREKLICEINCGADTTVTR